MTAKEFLQQYRDIDDSINAKLEQIHKLKLRAGSVSSPVGTGVHSSAPSDPVGSITLKIVDLEQEINCDIDRLVDIQHEIYEVITKVSEQRLRTILESCYLNLKSFEQIAVDMGYCYRHICRLHGKALAEVKRVLECHTPPVV